MSSQREIPTKPHDFQGDIDTIGRIDAVSTILDVVCRTTGMGFAAVARVTEERWIACQVLDNIDFGLGPGGELKVESTICHEIRENRAAVVINHVAEDPVYCSHHTPLAYGFQSYISMPIMLKDKTFFGTLCAIDPRPARLNNPETIGMFKLFAELIAAHIETDRQLRTSQAALVQERQLSDLREQFIAVLGHDLRNPVASVDSGARLLSRQPLNDKGRQILAMMQGSVTRMSGLIDNVLDFARARLGNGLDLVVEGAKPLRPVLEQVVNELASVDPSREIVARFDLDADRAIAVDHVRIAQLFSNLLGNALTHGEPGAPVRVGAGADGNAFVCGSPTPGRPSRRRLRTTCSDPSFEGRRARANKASVWASTSPARSPKPTAARSSPPRIRTRLASRSGCRLRRNVVKRPFDHLGNCAWWAPSIRQSRSRRVPRDQRSLWSTASSPDTRLA